MKILSCLLASLASPQIAPELNHFIHILLARMQAVFPLTDWAAEPLASPSSMPAPPPSSQPPMQQHPMAPMAPRHVNPAYGQPFPDGAPPGNREQRNARGAAPMAPHPPPPHALAHARHEPSWLPPHSHPSAVPLSNPRSSISPPPVPPLLLPGAPPPRPCPGGPRMSEEQRLPSSRSLPTGPFPPVPRQMGFVPRGERSAGGRDGRSASARWSGGGESQPAGWQRQEPWMRNQRPESPRGGPMGENSQPWGNAREERRPRGQFEARRR